jgi:hypothetical protein
MITKQQCGDIFVGLGLALVMAMMAMVVGLSNAAEPEITTAPFDVQAFISDAEGSQPPYLWIRITIPENMMLCSFGQETGSHASPLKVTPNRSAKYTVGEFQTIGPPPLMTVIRGDLVYYHTGQVTCNAPITRLSKNPLIISGTIRYALCNETECFSPRTVTFSVKESL